MAGVAVAGAAASADLQWIPAHWTSVEAIQRADAEAVDRHLREERPVLLTGGSIVPTPGWEDIGALAQKLASTQVLVKRSARERVAYFREDRNSGGHAFDAEAFVQQSRMPFPEFLRLADEAQQARAESADVERACPAKADKQGSEGAILYCQESLDGHPELKEEFGGWDWPWALRQTQRNGWGLPETNVLFMGSEGATTPAHFDEQHNFLNQVRGSKLVVLFAPQDYTRMYPFPVTHPCDRCSMVDVRHADLERFPRFAEARGHVATLGPGDLLYIPCGWWHYCRTLTHLAASVAFWARGASVDPTGPGGELKKPLGSVELARVRRNLEKILAEDVGARRLDEEAQRLLRLIASGGAQMEEDRRLQALKKLLGVLQIPEEDQLGLLVETLDGRFGLNLSAFV